MGQPSENGSLLLLLLYPKQNELSTPTYRIPIAKIDKIWYNNLAVKGRPQRMVGHAPMKGGGADGFDDFNHCFFHPCFNQGNHQIHKKVTITLQSDGYWGWVH